MPDTGWRKDGEEATSLGTEKWNEKERLSERVRKVRGRRKLDD